MDVQALVGAERVPGTRDEQVRRPPHRDTVTPSAAQLLGLQRSAGNRAVALLAARQPSARSRSAVPPVELQRCGPTPCHCSDEERADYAVQHPEESAEHDEADAGGEAGGPAPPEVQRCGPGSSCGGGDQEEDATGAAHPAAPVQRLVAPGDPPRRSASPGVAPPAAAPATGLAPVPLSGDGARAPAEPRPVSSVPAPPVAAGTAGAAADPASSRAPRPDATPGPGGSSPLSVPSDPAPSDPAASGPAAAVSALGAAPADVPAPAPDTASATTDGFGPGDEVTVLAEFSRAGETALSGAAEALRVAPAYQIPAGPPPSSGARGAAGGKPGTPPAQAPAGPRPVAPPVVAPVLPPAPATPAAPALSGDGGAATAATGSQAQAAIAGMGQSAPPLPPPGPPSAVPLTGAADPAQVATSRTAEVAGLEAQHAATGQQLAAFDPEPELHPPAPPPVVADGATASGPAAAESPGAPAAEAAGPAPGGGGGAAAAAGPAAAAAGQDAALAAARRAWATELEPQLAQERAGAGQLTVQHAADQGQVRAQQLAQLDAGVQERQGEREQLRAQARQQLDGQREQGRQRLDAHLEEGRNESAALVAQSGTEVQEAKTEGERTAAQHLTDGQQEAEREQAAAQQQVQAEQARASSQSSSWIGQAVSVVRDALASVRGVISSIWQSAQASLRRILTRARDLANRAIDAAISTVSGLVRRFVTALVAVVRRVVGVLVSAIAGLLATLRATLMLIVRSIHSALTALVGWVRSALGRLWSALKGLWARLKAAFASLMARLRALLRRILKPIKVSIGPIEVFPRMGVGGRRLGHLTTGDVPIFVGEIPTEIGIFIVFVTMRTDADLAFTGGGLGPGTIERLELLVDPLASHYRGSGTVSVAADASAALTLTGTYSGNASWMGLAGLGIEGGPQIPMSLTVKGANRTHAEVEYDRGTVRFARSNDLEICLVPAASVNAFLRIKAFSGLPLTLPGGSGPGGPGGEGIHCGPNCPTCTVDPGKPGPDRDDSVLPYKERILYQHRWNLENYRTEKCWRWSFDLAAMANGSGAAAGASSRLDTSGAPALFNELHAAAQPGTGAATPDGSAAAAQQGSGPSAAPSRGPTQDQETTAEECGDCCAGDTPSGKVRVRGWPKNGGFVLYGDGRRKHTSNTRCTPKGSGACDVSTLVAAATGPGTYGTCLTAWKQAAAAGDESYGSQLGSEIGDSEYSEIVKDAVEGGVQDSKGSYYTDHGSAIGADVTSGGRATSIAMVNDADSRAHIIPVSAMPSGGASATKVRAQAICKCVGDNACGGGKIQKKYFDVDDCRTAKRDAEKICNNDPEMIEKCTRPTCYYRHGDYKCPA